jgi:RNA polymerase sigma factor (sigma-70 family)
MAASIAQLFSQLPCWTSDAVLLQRYVHQCDEAAFTALVARHGALVLRLCRRILGDVHAAEDAFQATFLILARRAYSLKQPDALPAWLYGVARRVALKARGQSSRRAAAPLDETLPDPNPDPLTHLSARELLDILDEEVQRLPAAQRSAFVLCCLEGHTQEEAARMLGWTPGSIKGRLERGRQRLQARLQRRGIAVSAALALVVATRDRVAARVPALLLQSTVRAALHGGIGGTASTLAHGVLQTMFWTKVAGAMAVALTLALAASTTVALFHPWPTVEEPQDKAPTVLAPHREAGAGKPKARTDALGDPLPDGAIARLGTVRFRHGGRIDRMIFTPEGKQLVSKGDDGVRVWDTANGKELWRLAPPPGENWTQATDLSSDGEQLAVVHGPNSAVDLWNVRRGKKIDSFGQGDYSLVRLSPDGKLAAIGTNAAGIEIWDVARREKLRSWKAQKWQIMSLDFSADSRRLLTCGNENTLRLWDVATGRQLQEFAIPHWSVQNLTSVPLSPDGSLLAVIECEYVEPKKAGAEGTRKTCVSVWDTATGKQLQRLTAEPSKWSWTFLAVMFTSDSKRLFTSGPDPSLRIWDPRTGKELRKISSDPWGGHVLALSKDGKTLAAGTSMSIHLLDLPSGKAHEPPEGKVMACSNPYVSALSPDGRTAITSSWDNAPLVWDVDSGRIRQQLAKQNDPPSSLQFSRDGKTLFSCDYDNVLRLWDLSQGAERSHVQLNFERVFAKGILVSPDDRSLILSDGQGIIHRLDAATGKERNRFQGPKYLWGLGCSPDGRSLVGWSGDRKIRVWDTANGRLSNEYTVPKDIKGRYGFAGPNGGAVASSYSAALSPDGRLLVMGSTRGDSIPKRKEQYALIFKDLRTGQDIAHCDPLPAVPEILLFSPDGRMLACSGDWSDPTIHLLEVASGRERRCLSGLLGYVTSLSFSANGRRLLSGGHTEALVWDLGNSRTGRTATAAEVEKLWADLAGADAACAYAAIHKLAAAPNAAIPFLQKHLPPVPAADKKRMARLIADLDSDDFATRQKATEELEKLGELALPAYRKARDGKPSLETRRRLEDLQRKAHAAWWEVSGERLRSLRAIEALELAGTPEAREVLATLAAGAEGARLTEEAKAALKRLQR